MTGQSNSALIRVFGQDASAIVPKRASGALSDRRHSVNAIDGSGLSVELFRRRGLYRDGGSNGARARGLAGRNIRHDDVNGVPLMPAWIVVYMRVVDRFNCAVGRCAMYLVFAMIGVLLYASVARSFFIPPLWTLETAQFLMAAYYLLGGAYSLQLASHVRMDLFYGRWSDRTQTWVDSFTVFFLIFYLAILLYGGFSSTSYALEYGERSYSAWRPYMAPIKIVMCFGILMMLLQAIATLFRSIAKLRGDTL